MAIIYEDFGSESLNKLITQQRLSILIFFNVAIGITENLSLIHSANIIHKDINASNIVFNSATGQVKIIDFGISTVLSREIPTIRSPNVLEGTLAYMSPEQTGRMNRVMDYRTNFYSLGITFYEMLTQQLPFNASDVMELVHCHIAKQPISPHQLNPEIPEAVSDIVMKLLSKTAEERYQSALGIKADLQQCLQLQEYSRVFNFPLGKHDFSAKFQVSQKIYGREQEIQKLLAAIERVGASLYSSCLHSKDIRKLIPTGKSEMILVSGYSGIGKSALVREIYNQLRDNRVILLLVNLTSFNVIFHIVL